MAIAQPVLAHVMPRTPDQQRAALGARSIRGIAINIPLVDVVQSGSFGDFARSMQRFGGRAWLVAQLEIGMERGEMQRNIRTEMFENPFGKRASLFRRVVESRNH